MEWDKFRMAQQFLQRANAIHPDESEGLAHDEALALQDLYYDCYMSSFSREELIKRLTEVQEGKVELPEETEVDEKRYRDVYKSKAGSILDALKEGRHPVV